MSLTFAEVSRPHQEFIQNTLNAFEQQLHPSSKEDAELVTRAMFSVRNQAVRMRNYSPFNQILTCQIQDVRLAEVTINFPRKQISCSCPQAKMCRHQLAVIFKLSQYFLSLQDWATKWRSKKTIPLQSLAANRSPENWQRMVDEVMNYTFKDNRPIEGFLIASFMDNSRLKLQRQRPFEREWQDLFDLFIEVAMLKRLYTHSIQTKMPLEGNYFGYYLDNTFTRMWQAMNELSNTKRLFAAEPFIDALQENIRAIALMEKGSPHHRLTFYVKFWMELLNDPKRATKELALLESMSDLQSDIDLTTVKIVHYLLLDAKTAFEQALEEMTLLNIEAYIEIAQFALIHGYALYAEDILKKALPLLPLFIQENLSPVRRQKFTRLLHTLYAQVPLSETDEMTLYAAFGKYGIDSFSDYLLRNERYYDWVALHQLYPSSISYLDQCGLKDVIASAPEAALPLYHFYAVDEIKQKSRQNYKQAVRIWRSMKSAAKKSGKLDYFAAYMEAVQQQYKRLRALQEEINKSNLLI
ncbi:hypothetical protein DCE79_02495 [Lysinibacillus sp. 2017]|uniref:SWIM zinc finger family protein n=1 Tax=Lysinibacillus sp. 2017 TaxID=2169540 RepID=UPI000D52A00B|nr:SWIM zinc finger family protein [Lysinibacillus sp. 2017]AWE06323.1 hypothetical protein DCE79_02495 [Lysinibacillus sp. 2017]TGN34999.1 hypothetical protein E4L99_11905 [Lysinibacillus sp. S2017]